MQRSKNLNGPSASSCSIHLIFNKGGGGRSQVWLEGGKSQFDESTSRRYVGLFFFFQVEEEEETLFFSEGERETCQTSFYYLVDV